MPYANIHWIKLEVRLLNDPRFFLMSEKSQLLFIKILLGLGNYGGKLPLSWSILGSILRLGWKESEFDAGISEIKKNFPKVIVNNGFIKITDFKKKHNWVEEKELRGNSEGTPKEASDKIRIDKNRIDKIINTLIEVQGWVFKDNPSLLTDVYRRHGLAAKRLLLLTNDDDKAVGAIQRMAREYKLKGLSWTLETVIKHLPELLTEPKSPGGSACKILN